MESLKQIRLGIGFLVVIGASPYLIYDFHKITKGQAGLSNWLLPILAACLAAWLLLWFLRLRGENYVRWKPLLDRPVALMMMMISAPILLISAILIKLESPGPAIYRQERVGQNKRRADRRRAIGPSDPSFTQERRKNDRRKHDLGGKPFIIYKLRTMETNAEEATGAAWSTGESDPRVTKVGYYLRKIHIDELPQLYNALLGQMSVIGPRPERPAFIARLNKTISGYEKRLLVPPGITGLAQIRRKHDESLEDVKDKLGHDCEYINNISLLLDVQIMFQTLLHIANLFWEALKRRAIRKAAPKTISAIFDENPERF